MLWASHLFGSDGLLGSFGELFNSSGIVSEIVLAANENDGQALAEVKDFGDPLSG